MNIKSYDAMGCSWVIMTEMRLDEGHTQKDTRLWV